MHCRTLSVMHLHQHALMFAASGHSAGKHLCCHAVCHAGLRGRNREGVAAPVMRLHGTEA